MLNNIDPNNIDLTKIVAKSISKLSWASEANFKVQEQRDKIMHCIFDLLNIPDCDILNSTLEALVKVADLNYQYMQPYLEEISSMTQTMITNASENN
jgi:predicted transcriptional regulator